MSERQKGFIMSLETEQYDPVKTHWVRVVVVSLQMPDAEKILEGLYENMNRQALKEDKVILNIGHTVVTDPKSSQMTIAYVVTAQIVSRAILEQQQVRQRLSRN